MNRLPLIAFAVTCKNRTQHIAQTIPANLAGNSDYQNLKIVLVDYGDPGDLKRYIQENHTADIESGRLVVYRFETDRFRMAHGKNLSHRCALLEGAEIIVNVDADNFTNPGFASYVAEVFPTGREESLIWARWNQPGMEQASRIAKGCCGRIGVTKRAFLKTGGYDEVNHNSWSPDDKEFHFRLRRLGYQAQAIPARYLGAVLHTDKMRFKEYPEAKHAAYDLRLDTYNDTDDAIANYGHFGEGVVYRNYSEEPITLGPVPTRVFGVGMHRTASTSLNNALKIIGYDSAHWESVKWARRIWQEMVRGGKSRTIERHYAISDLPVPILFKELDKAYPGSKFVLTIRNETDWLRSVQKHWSKANGWKDTWNKESGFPRFIHEVLYGQPDFDALVFLERYRRHNAEVRDYFKNRPGDLLIMDMDAGAGWKELCGFLGEPIPNEEYPRNFVSQ